MWSKLCCSKLLLSEGHSGVLFSATSVALLDKGRCVVRGAAICSSLLGEGRLLGRGAAFAVPLWVEVLFWSKVATGDAATFSSGYGLCYRRRR